MALETDFLRVHGSDLPADRLALVEMIQRGLPVDEVESAATAAGISMKELVDCGAIPARTLTYSRRAGRFSPALSNRFVRLIRAWTHARKTFGTVDKARLWMNRPTRALGGRKPVDLLDTDEGGRLVDELLGHIEHGIAA